MYYEMRTYTIRPGKLHGYIKHFGTVGLPILFKYSKLIGYWYTEVDELNQLIHIWAYESLDERALKRADLYEDINWQQVFLPKAMSMLERQENKIMRAVSFSPIK